MNPSTDTDPQELNQRCAILTGWKWFDHPDVREATKTFTLKDKWVMDPVGKLQFPHSVSDYCHDANSALLLVAELRKSGWTVRFHDELDGTWQCIFSKEGPYHSHYGLGNTFCLAIVHAFLSATEGRV